MVSEHKDGGDDIDWAGLFRLSIFRPRDAARQVVTWDLPISILLEAAVAVSCLGAVITWIGALLMPGAGDPLILFFGGMPVLIVVTQLINLVMIAALITGVGRLCGGHGTLKGAFTTIVWINTVMILLQLAQSVVVWLIPPLALLVSFLLFNWVIWAMTVFIAELHGFKNIFAVAVLVFLTAMVMTFGLISVLTGLGMVPQGVGDV